ncbi:carbon-nitrogen hydrolase family protein [Acinetobacter rathckeae]|uniref:carbon-nitrogen hydrolase family protein n=1 Tax=Acinetobacter rathckeae TaxID=2605272 RepID=UPI0018A2ED77|nr:carbon-nitrogen hydrolase family protein [Acinetobacter rathckeae]MBF7696600.1 carbon-nitrogen hydrolase family protein [Acinetobacter rathckeae]
MALLSVAQMTSQNVIEDNLSHVKDLVLACQAQGSQLLVLPENFACFAPGQQRETAAQFEYIQSYLEQLSHTSQIWIVAGTIPCPFRPNGDIVPDGKVRTTSLCISPEGTVARYDKIHLFDVIVNDAIGGYQESAQFEAGDEIVVARTPFGHLGLMVCYDLRFPELALALRKQNADFLTAPAAFTFLTGQAHWQILLQARAIDTQCAVLGAAQQGLHGEKRETWGHAGIVNAYGKLLCEVTTAGNHVAHAEIDLTAQQSIRYNMPLMQHRRL